MANQLPNQDPAVDDAFNSILKATHDAANAEHTRLNYQEEKHIAAISTKLTSTLDNLDAAITKKLSEMHQKHVSSPATLFSQSVELKNTSSVEADNSTTPGPSKS
ncbi:MAG: hypothetical protein CMF55_04140 [Legionellales bacterium]|nr:hypothetical protein [Legionellales bacterium]HAG62294.1 hypothetical protein [Coxiellaceae bacterium]|tara:strand:- start:25 stop:339 length:315 start_codon:yes stop_codon:yes gene_type:complete